MKPRSWLIAALVGLLAVLVLGAFPVQAYLDQGRQRDDLRARIAELNRANEALERKAADLKDPARVEALARERYQLVRPGEEAYSILPSDTPAAPPSNSAPVTKPEPHQSWFGKVWSKVTSLL